MKVLVVDDFATMRKIVRTCLKDLGIENVTEADNGKAALDLLRAADANFQLVISDWNMPSMTGIDLLRYVRADPALKAMPFILVTAEAQKEHVLEAAKAGVSNYVVKPFTSDQLQTKLSAVFAKIK